MKNNSLIIIIILLVALAGLTFFALNKKTAPIIVDNQPVACTMEAKLCPDGSSVGRGGPNCEFTACPDIKVPTPKPTEPTPSLVKTVKFNTPVVFKIDQVSTFPDKLQMTLNTINDSRCPKGVMCVWAGEILGTFSVSGGNIGTTPEKINLSQMTSKVVKQKGYTFTLNSATEDSMNITVANDSVESCYVGGCSGQICSDKEGAITTCEFRPEYSCYSKNSKCERQSTGQCGWTPTDSLKACLANPPASD